MKKYGVHDLQGASFMSYTWTEDWTAEDIRTHLRDQFNDQSDEDRVPDNVSLDEMLDIFELKIEERTA